MIKEQGCACGKAHINPIDKVIIGKDVLGTLPAVLAEYGAKKVFVLSDLNTYRVAGKAACDILTAAGIPFTSYTLEEATPEPDEKTTGSMLLHYDPTCNVLLTVGSGVLNDTAKLLAAAADLPYIIVATAPSMDGYASQSSSMCRDGLKISLGSRTPNVIIGDVNILKEAPMDMLRSGLGDMLAKYVSICEWRIANLITGEYYCEEVAEMVRQALKKCTDNAKGLLERDAVAVQAVFEGLVNSGIAMSYAGVSRPASGVEHYLSHVWDMRGVSFGTPVDSHGTQCAIGTLIATRFYEKLKQITPDREKALAYVRAFDYSAWSQTLTAFLGKAAKCMIALEAKEKKYDVAAHAERLERILANWDHILCIINEELPSSAEIADLLDTIGAPKSMSEIGIDEDLLPKTFHATKDIRDKYVLSRLCWDLGVIDEIAATENTEH